MKMDLLAYNNENLLVNFPPILRKHFEELFTNGKIGLSQLSLNDISSTKQYTENNSTYSYYFTLRIPYAGKRLTWELILDPDDMSFPPDFNFNDDNFHMSTEIDSIIENVPSLTNWNVNNPKSLTSVIREFVTLFKKQQLERLQRDNIYAQLNAEYQTLTEEISPNDIELFLENTCAHFLINLKVDISSLPEYLQPMKNGDVVELLNPGDDTCTLKVSYLKLDASRMNSSLQLSPRIDQVLGSRKNIHIPTCTKNTSLSDYVNIIIKLLQDHVKQIERHHKLKKAYISCLCAVYAESLIEFDSDTFNRCVLVCEVEGYSCLVHIEIGELFPEEKPTVTLQSLYCTPASPSKKICSEKVDYAYSSTWGADVMVEKLAISLSNVIPKFQNHKH